MPRPSYVYIVQFANMLKVGYSRSLTPQQQTWRYATFYHKFGLNIWEHSKPKELERQLKTSLKPFATKVNGKSGELFWNHDGITTDVFSKAKRICIENDAKCTQKIGYDRGWVMTLNLDDSIEKSIISGTNAK